MSLFKTIKRPFSKLAYALFAHAPASWERKFVILMDVLSQDTRRIHKVPPMALDFLSPPDLEGAFPGLDADSLTTLRRFVASQYFSDLYNSNSIPPYAYVWSGICTQDEVDKAQADEKHLKELRARYQLRSGKPSSLIHHHGLRCLPAKVLANLQDTVFVDAGAYEGDSTLVFLQYHPQVVWAFEPSPPNQAIFRHTMQANGVPEKSIRLIPKGLSDKPSTIHFDARVGGECTLTNKGRCKAELVTLDSLAPPTRIGLIKADLEGMGMFMLRGAAETIRRDKPVLTLNFYHNPDEFLNTYAFVRNLGVPYEYKILTFYPPWKNYEVALLAWPSDLS